jgi:AraC-like DNA-binding protein
MSVLADTSWCEPDDRFEYWHSAASEVFFPLAVRRDGGGPFRARVTGHALGAIGVYRIESDPSTVERRRAGIAALDPRHAQISLVTRGTVRFEQDGRWLTLRPGGVTTYDSSHPYRVVAEAPYELRVFSIPWALLGTHAARIRRHTTIAGEGAAADLAVPFLAGLVDRLDDATVRASEVDFADGVLALVRGLFGGRPEPRLSSDALYASLIAYVERHLGDPALGPEALARAHLISRRYVHRLFAERGTTVAAWIRSRRLERSRRDLQDPAHAYESVAEVARRWGVTNPSYFSRVFRDAYGMSPTAARRSSL